MHGLNTIVRLNKVQQDFVDEILLRPRKEENLLDAWREWKAEQKVNEPVQVRPY